MEERPEPGTVRPAAERTAQDRTIRALVSLADDLSVEGGEDGFLRSSLQHLIESLGPAGGDTFLLQADGSLSAAAEWRLPGADRSAAAELAQSMVNDEQPRVCNRPEG